VTERSSWRTNVCVRRGVRPLVRLVIHAAVLSEEATMKG